MPDLIVSLYNEDDGTKIGYIRQSAFDIYNMDQQQFKWYPITDVKNKNRKIAQLLANFQLCKVYNEDIDPVKNPEIRRGISVNYLFFAQVVSGFGLAPEVGEEKLKTRVEMRIGENEKNQNTEQNSGEATPKCTTAWKKSRFPFYKHFQAKEITLLNDLEFASDLTVTVVREEHSFWGDKTRDIGSFVVPLTSIGTLYSKPQYFNVIDQEGNARGKILARFYMVKSGTTKSKIKQYQRYISDEMLKLYERPPLRVNINLVLIGIRNLISPTFKAKLDISLTEHLGTKKEQKHNIRRGKEEHKSEKSHAETLSDEDNLQYNPSFQQRSRQISFTSKKEQQGFTQLKEVELASEPLLWPLIKFELTDSKSKEGTFLKGEQCETCFTLVPLIQFIPEGQVREKGYNPNEIELTMRLMQRSQASIDILLANPDRKIADIEADVVKNPLPFKQESKNPIRLYSEVIWAEYLIMKSKGLSENNQYISGVSVNPQELYNFIQDEKKPDEYLEQQLKSFLKLKDMVINTENQINSRMEGINNRLTHKGDNMSVSENENSSDIDSAYSSETDHEEIFKQKKKKDKNPVQNTFFKQTNTKDESKQQERGKILIQQSDDEDDDENSQNQAGNEDVANLLHHKEPIFSIKVTQQDKVEERQRKERQKILYTNMRKHLTFIDRKLRKKKATAKVSAQIQVVQQEMSDIAQILKDIRDGRIMDDEMFTQHERLLAESASVFGQGGGENWLKEKPKTPGEYEATFSLPFIDYPLLKEATSYWDKQEMINGINLAGRATGGFLRAAISLIKLESETNEASNMTISSHQSADSQSENSENKKENEQDSKKQDFGILLRNEGNDKIHDRWDNFTKQFLKEHQFNLTNCVELRQALDPPGTIYMVNVYILEAKNLTAIDSELGIIDRLAGHSARSKADPYVTLRLGKAKLVREQTMHSKMCSDRNHAKEKTLNPGFFSQYTLEACLPEDWKLEISIWDQGSNVYSDQLIGSTIIDLEKRRLGMKGNQVQLLLSAAKAATTLKQNQYHNNQQNEKEDVHKWGEIAKQKQQHESLLKKVHNSSPIESRELRIPGKDTPQGVLEMFVDLYKHEEQKHMFSEKFNNVTRKQDYEVRLIIWEATNVPTSDDGYINVMIAAKYFKEQFSAAMHKQTTDCQNGVQDGKAVFNWRMKFTIKMPAEYPRIKLQLFDERYLNDEAIGESDLNLKDSIVMMTKEGTLPNNKIWVPMKSPKDPEENRGYVRISMTIVTAEEAELNPVGLGHEEPNANPKLIAPNIGRGNWAAVSAAVGSILPNISFEWNMWRKIILMISILSTLGIIMFLMMYFK